MELTCKLTNLDKSKASFRGDVIGQYETVYYGKTTTKDVVSATVTIARDTWVEAGSPNTITVVL